MTTTLEPPELSWPQIGAGVGAVLSFACGLLVGYARAPREHREVMNDYIAEAVSTRIQQGRRIITQKFLAILEVPNCYDAAVLAYQLERSGLDIVEATVLEDRRQCDRLVQEERRGTHVKDVFVPLSAAEKARAY
jgi:hypothetical protein